MSISENHSKENANTNLDHPKLYIGLARQYAQYEPPRRKIVSVADGTERTCGTDDPVSRETSIDALYRKDILKMILWAKGIQNSICKNDCDPIMFVCDCLGMKNCRTVFWTNTPNEFIVFEDATPEEVAEVRRFIAELQRRILPVMKM